MNENALVCLNAVRCFLLDMDGTFCLGNRLIDGSLAFLEALRRTGRDAWFVTNNSSKSAAAYVDKLTHLGVPEPFCRQVITSGHAAARYLQQHYPQGRGFLLGNEGLRAELTAMGMAFTDEHPDYVLVAFDTTLNYAKMCRVCDYIRAGVPYIATHPDFNCPTENGFIPDAGAIMAFIEASTGRKADVILGKPHGGMILEAQRRTGYAPAEMGMVGDRLYTDIAAGVNHGIPGILVLSGEATLADVAASEIRPDLIFGRLADMIPYIR